MTWHLHLTGLVQGVGFRPFVWQLVQAMQLRGTVCNGVDGVHIYVNADRDTAERFRHLLREKAPPLAQIDTIRMETAEPTDFADFRIIESDVQGQPNLLLPPDIALCATCRTELTEPANRRFGYAFTTCTHCGPRYSILQKLPYDRPATTMAPFGMCADCRTEYYNPADRRFFAQTNSCPACPVEFRLFGADGTAIDARQEMQVDVCLTALRQGSIVAVKGIGGYLLLCDATNADTVETLRERKHRPAKPLAVLYPDRATLEGDCHVRADEWDLLTGVAAPIVLLRRHEQPASGIAVQQLAPGLDHIGAMLPYAPLLALLAEGFSGPLVATSGNRSGFPICYTNEQALTQLTTVADYILTHNRAIAVPQDDSVMWLTPVFRQPVMLRRSRGYAPTYIPALPEGSGANTLALGASLKSTFAWQLRGNTYVSQYLGDLESFDTQEQFRQTLTHFRTLFNATPTLLLADAHEGYFSTQLARELSATWNIPLRLVQHHEAHLAAVLAEHDLLNQPQPVLGILWDGTGYGTDGQVWGGEFIAYKANTDEPFTRMAHFAYFDALLGDKMPREPRLSALSLVHEHPAAESLLRNRFTAVEWAFYQKLLPQNRLKTSSVGRLFDAVASLLGLTDQVSYEGEAALLLEEHATRFVEQNGFTTLRSYLPRPWFGTNVPTQHIAAGVLADRLANVPVGQIAATFHYTLVEVVAAVARQTGHTRLAFSGGVFQNALLVDWLRHRFGHTHTLFFHRQLSPGDECIALGQLAHVTCTQLLHEISDNDVLSYSR
ncbi:carbamoyltransferase HypF [Spirosoma montaniterrae]|uniref:Carbamoyltransferase n=1 Tax=Spirosoma montaniterrae TaxID=1178516 RepID=A0A1P9WU55_9BACT|nr:carbamoyltransferase HypF [Spirosoma montaniterrae]AQG78925.1 hydrogenase maturation protein HypF [Spirosoma montaniterrae]